MNPCIECGTNCCLAQMEGKECKAMNYEARPHGEWIYFEDDDYASGGYNMCSVCNWKFSFGAYPLIYENNYCPHCGAKMEVSE